MITTFCFPGSTSQYVSSEVNHSILCVKRCDNFHSSTHYTDKLKVSFPV